LQSHEINKATYYSLIRHRKKFTESKGKDTHLDITPSQKAFLILPREIPGRRSSLKRIHAPDYEDSYGPKSDDHENQEKKKGGSKAVSAPGSVRRPKLKEERLGRVWRQTVSILGSLRKMG